MSNMENSVQKQRLLNLPNILTAIRLLLVPVFIWLYLEEPERPWKSVVVYVVASVTDFVDGYLARRWNQVTWFGKLFDPFADKLLSVAVLACLLSSGIIPAWVLVIVVAKELYMLVGSSYLLALKHVVKADWAGKIATGLFMLSTVLTVPWHGSETVVTVGRWMMMVSVAVMLYAAIHYTVIAVKNKDQIISR